MKEFMGKDFLLGSTRSAELYEMYAKDQPVYDYHCHLDPRAIAEDRSFDNIGELWLEGDHYKWRILRAYGIPEEKITGKETPYKERFMAFAEALPSFIGNPVYHWAHMELARYFGIRRPLSAETAEGIWNEANEKIRKGGFSARSLIARSNVELIVTTDDPADTLEWHAKIAVLEGFKTRVVPAWRPDKILNMAAEGFRIYVKKLGESGKQEINTLEDLLDVLRNRMDFFESRGCRIADHGMMTIPAPRITWQEAKTVFSRVMAGSAVTDEEAEGFAYQMLRFFGCEYAKREWTMQLHISVVRNQNSRLFQLVGSDCGVDSCGDPVSAPAVGRLFDHIEREGGMPRTIVYTMNPADYYVLSSMAGNFAGGIRGKMQLGSAWWMMDHRDGMLEHLRTLAATGGLGLFVGMLTDSRSFLSYARHDYFRRILCSLLGEWVEAGEVPDDPEFLGRLIQGICIENAREYFRA